MANPLTDGTGPDLDALVGQAAQQYGLEPDLLRQIIRAESAGNPNARSSSSSASGLFQITKPTWEQYGSGNPFDPGANIAAGARLTADNVAKLKAAGYEPNPTNVYLAHFAGAGGALRVLSADPNSPVAGLLDERAIRANPWLSRLNAGDLQSWASNRIAGKPQSVNFLAKSALGRMSDTSGLQRLFGLGGAQEAPDDQGQIPAHSIVADALKRLTGAGGTERFQTWPERFARGIIQGATHLAVAPGEVYRAGAEGKNPTVDEMIPIAADMAHTLTGMGRGFPMAGMGRPEGSLGVFIGPKARTWNPITARAAEEAETVGVPSADVWRQTGYSGRQFADAQTRAEIAAHESRWNPASKTAFMQDERPLSEALHFPELYEAYPQLRDIPVSGNTRGSNYGQLSGSPEGKLEIAIRNDLNPDFQHGVALHEVQHAVDSIEGRDYGSNRRWFLPPNFEEAKVQAEKMVTPSMANQAYSAAKKTADEMGIPFDRSRWLAITPHLPKIIGKEIPESMYSSVASGKLIKALVNDPSVSRYFEAYNRHMQPLIDMENAAYDMYRRTSGEVLARLSANRLPLSQRQTQAIVPAGPNPTVEGISPGYFEQDVPLEQQLVNPAWHPEWKR